MTEIQHGSYQIKPIGKIHSPFKEKFGLPRQANLLSNTSAFIELYPPYNDPDAVKGLSGFTHIWLTFAFHKNSSNAWRPLIRPPRLGGNEKIGVFASRSPFRPNGLGLSLAELKAVNINDNSTELLIACPDLLDGTPIFDIKPYIHYADSAKTSKCAYAEEAPKAKLAVNFEAQAQSVIEDIKQHYPGNLVQLIIETLAYDPRPAYKAKKADDKTYKLRLYDLDVCFRVNENIASVLEVLRLKI
jgi:tRNA (adenine37-N6)-methyltransferase